MVCTKKILGRRCLQAHREVRLVHAIRCKKISKNSAQQEQQKDSEQPSDKNESDEQQQSSQDNPQENDEQQAQEQLKQRDAEAEAEQQKKEEQQYQQECCPAQLELPQCINIKAGRQNDEDGRKIVAL